MVQGRQRLRHVALFAALAGCAPDGDAGGCANAADCARGELCIAQTGECEPSDELDTDRTGRGGGDFGPTNVPFFRARLCAPSRSDASLPLPVELTPCLHPCLTPSQFRFRHLFECGVGGCEVQLVAWVQASGTACPDDVFARFNVDSCEYDAAIAGWPPRFNIDLSTATGSNGGSVLFEVPFLSNEDIATVAAGASDPVLNDLIRNYPQEPNRLGRPVRLERGGPTPPAQCMGDTNCACVDVGF